MTHGSQTQTWLDGARRGDQVALSKLLARHHPTLRMRAYARMGKALRSKLEPEDILQEVYLDVFRQIDRFEEASPGSFFNWVLTILDSKVADAGRALHRRVRDIAREVPPRAASGTDSYWNLLDHLYIDSRTPSRVVRHEEAVGALLACLSQLPDLQRQVLRLRFLEGCPVQDVADRLDKPSAVIVATTKRALESLRRSMDRLGDFTRGS